MKKQKKSASIKTIMIYHHQVDLESKYGITYWIITEMVDSEPVQTYYFKIPDNYKTNDLLGELHEKYCSYCPN